MTTEQIRVDKDLFRGRLDVTSEALRGKARFEALVGNHEEAERGEAHEKL